MQMHPIVIFFSEESRTKVKVSFSPKGHGTDRYQGSERNGKTSPTLAVIEKRLPFVTLPTKSVPAVPFNVVDLQLL